MVSPAVQVQLITFIFYPCPRTFFSLLLEREGGRDENIDVREKHRLVASPMCLDRGLNLQPRYVP